MKAVHGIEIEEVFRGTSRGRYGKNSIENQPNE